MCKCSGNLLLKRKEEPGSEDECRHPEAIECCVRFRAKHTKGDDWIFVDNDSGEQIHKKVYYKQWDSLLKECGLKNTGKTLTYYSLRHSYITYRLINGVNAFFLAKNSGTSIKMIESHYEHIKSEAMKYELTKRMKQDEVGQILLD